MPKKGVGDRFEGYTFAKLSGTWFLYMLLKNGIRAKEDGADARSSADSLK